MAKLFRVVHDFSVADRWYLGEPILKGQVVDASGFLDGASIDLPAGNCVIPVSQGTVPLDFTLAAFDMPVVTAAVARLISSSIPDSGLQLLPATAAGHAVEILNVLSVVDAIDFSRTEHTRWTASDGRPDKVGRLRAVYGLHLDEEKARGIHLFRLADWKIALIASEDLKQALEAAKVTGIRFQPVS